MLELAGPALVLTASDCCALVDRRGHEAIAAAGGSATDADPDQLNLAAVLEDGQKVLVPRQGETAPAGGPAGGGAAVGDTSARGSPADGEGSPPVAGKINLNTAEVDDIIWGTSSQRGKQGGDLGRMAALDAGYDVRASGVTLDRYCGSGITAVNLAAAQVMSGMEDLVIAGGTEMMSYTAASAAPRNPEAAGRGRVAPPARGPVRPSGASGRVQPSRQARSRRGKK